MIRQCAKMVESINKMDCSLESSPKKPKDSKDSKKKYSKGLKDDYKLHTISFCVDSKDFKFIRKKQEQDGEAFLSIFVKNSLLKYLKEN